MTYAEIRLNRTDLGLPRDWERVEDWISTSRDVPKPSAIPSPVSMIKNPEIPVLKNYEKPPPREFWEIFPSNYPKTLRQGGVKVRELEKVIDFCKKDWTLSEKITAAKAVRNLKGEKEVDLIDRLPPHSRKKCQNRHRQWNRNDRCVGHLAEKGVCCRSL